MHRVKRKTAPRVVGGRPQRKNRWQETPSCYNTFHDTPVVDRKRPGAGFRHVLKKRDIERFLPLLPDWKTLSEGLDVILLAPGDAMYDGWHRPGIVAVCAWEADRILRVVPWYYRQHHEIFEKLGVPCAELDDGEFECEFTESTARAYQLLHVLLHELGHHHDRMTTRCRQRSSRGEDFAEQYALNYSDRIWENYLSEFGLP